MKMLCVKIRAYQPEGKPFKFEYVFVRLDKVQGKLSLHLDSPHEYVVGKEYALELKEVE